MKISNGVNKKISFPIAIIIIVVWAVLLGLTIWQYGLLIPEIGPSGPSPRPSGEKVTITIDKTEYEQGEVIKITVKNGLDKSIWYSGNLPSEFSWWGLEKLENGIGGEVYIRKPLIENGKEECILIVYERFDIVSSITELKPNSEIVDEWDFKNCEAPSEIGTELELKFIDPGTYRFSFNYAPAKEIYLEGRYNEEKTIYSNEFTIKEK